MVTECISSEWSVRTSMNKTPIAIQRSGSGAILNLNRSYRSSTIYSDLKYKFLRNLQSDLRKIGIPAVMRSYSSRHLGFELRPCAVTAEQINGLLSQERRKRLHAERKFLLSMLQPDVEKHFIDGQDLRPDLISPSIQFCVSKQDRSIFRLCMMLQSVPPQRLLYRQILAVVRDTGHPRSPIIGAFGLASSGQALACRDHFLKWHSSPEAKKRGLQRSMQLAVCISVPPYCYLRGGKLVAALAASKRVADLFYKKYRPDRLEAISTTSARGLHSPIFNRVMVRPGGLYKRIGETSGYSTLIFSRATLLSARALVKRRDGFCPENRTIQMLKRALNLCNAPREQIMRLGVRKGVYLAVEDRSSSSPYQTTAWPSEDEIVRFWKTHLVPKCLARADIMQKLTQSNCRELLSELVMV
jgi:hypothetical protein